MLFRSIVDDYLTLITERSTGELLTTAQWFRQFVERHEAYHQDSALNQAIVHDLTRTAISITNGTVQPTQLLGEHKTHNAVMTPSPDGSSSATNGDAIDSEHIPLRGASDAVCLNFKQVNCCDRLKEFMKHHVHTNGHHQTNIQPIQTDVMEQKYSTQVNNLSSS